MPGRSAQARLDDIRDALNGISATLDGVAFDQFRKTWYLQRAVERGLEIISEASRSLPDEMKAMAPSVPWPAIAGIGNILRHEYQRVEPTIVWNIVEDHLMALRLAIELISASLETRDAEAP